MRVSRVTGAGALTTRPQRELAAACLLTLGGAGLVLVATSGSTGAEAIPVARALALVALAGSVALLAARRWSRLAAGVVLAVTGLGLVGSAVTGPAFSVRTALIAAGGLLVLAAGLVTVGRGRAWPALGARYDAPAARRAVSPGDVWDALDRGEDPTAFEEEAPRP